MATMSKPISARRKLELSQLTAKAIQQEGMGEDVDFKKFTAYVSSIVKVDDLKDRITSAGILRTIEGASTLTVGINDYDRKVLRSGLLVEKMDVNIDGLWFRLTTVDKTGDDLTLTFEDREIAILRTYNTWRIVQRGKMTRAEFIYSMLKEVKEFNFVLGKNCIIPELHTVQPIERYQGDIAGIDAITSKSRGISKDVNKQTTQDTHRHGESNTPTNKNPLTVKNKIADADQIKNANIILQVGDSMAVSRRLKVVALMTGITETLLRNEPGGVAAHNLVNDAAGDDSAGILQQRPSWGSYTDRTNVETAARLFYERAIVVEQQHLTDPYWVICADVQHPAIQYETRYSLWRVEADRFVTAYGDTGGTVPQSNNMTTQEAANVAAAGPFYFWRGTIVDRGGLKIRKKENTWDCTQRLVDEVDWRSFFVSGTYYLMSEKDLFQQLPLATISEFQPGVNAVDGNYDRAKKSATITLKAEVGRWQVPPGSVITLVDMGPYNGRWLVNEYDRDLIGENREATITLKKPRPQLPEPLGSNATDINTTWVPAAGDSANIAPTKDLITQVLTNKNIIFSNSLETSDVTFGKIDDRVLQFLMWLTSQVGTITVTALKSDHNIDTTEGRVSAHSVGKAVDIGKIGDVLCGNNDMTIRVMKLIEQYQFQLQFDQLIGPYPLLCIPKGFYDAQTLGEHKTHIHTGWPI